MKTMRPQTNRAAPVMCERVKCGHPERAHLPGGWRGTGCLRPGCKCGSMVHPPISDD